MKRKDQRERDSGGDDLGEWHSGTCILSCKN